LFDPQTSGGLLIVVAEAALAQARSALAAARVDAAVIGRVAAPETLLIHVI
jgi:selenophosphate synthase